MQAYIQREENDSRSPNDAYFEFGMCYVLGFGVISNQQKGLDLILKAAQEGSVQAQAYSCRLFDAFNRSLIEDHRSAYLCWLKAGAKEGYWAALESLRSRDRTQYEETKQRVRTRFCGIAFGLSQIDLDETHLDAIREELKSQFGKGKAKTEGIL